MQHYADYVAALYAAQDIDQCFAALEREVVRRGFDGVVYSSYLLRPNPEKGVSPVLLRSEGFDEAFLTHYVEAGFADHDFTIKRILSGDLNPVDWWEEESRGALDHEERVVIEVACQEYGLRNGVSIPTLRDKEEIAGASLVSRDKPSSYHEMVREHLGTLRYLVRLFHDRIHAEPDLRNAMTLERLSDLTRKEREVLKHLCTGRPLKSIDGQEVTPAYANKLSSELAARLGADNRQQLRYILGLLRIQELW